MNTPVLQNIEYRALAPEDVTLQIFSPSEESSSLLQQLTPHLKEPVLAEHLELDTQETGASWGWLNGILAERENVQITVLPGQAYMVTPPAEPYGQVLLGLYAIDEEMFRSFGSRNRAVRHPVNHVRQEYLAPGMVAVKNPFPEAEPIIKLATLDEIMALYKKTRE